jgi:DNA invertase Pin-like site-specific DNA recombinase
VDVMTTLYEPTTLGVGFVSLTEALDLTMPAGRAFAGFLAVFAEFKRDLIRERIKAGITDTRKQGKAHGRPRAHANNADQIRHLAQQGLSQAAIARQLGIWRTSVRRVLTKETLSQHSRHQPQSHLPWRATASLPERILYARGPSSSYNQCPAYPPYEAKKAQTSLMRTPVTHHGALLP